jgi:hypothetical protein
MVPFSGGFSDFAASDIPDEPGAFPTPVSFFEPWSVVS